jgi:hypothetical protein
MRNRQYKNLTAAFFERKNQIIVTFIVLLLLFSCVLFSQSTLLTYSVMRNGNQAGWVKVSKNINGNTSIINLTSEMKVRFIFLFTIVSNEYVESKNEKLIHSYVYRKVNTDVKANVHTRWTGSSYEKEDASQKEKLTFEPVSFNVLDLYFREPTGFDQVYSGSQQQNLRIQKKQAGVYKLYLPDGDFNEYYYNSDGICSSVKIDHGFYSVEFVLTQPQNK